MIEIEEGSGNVYADLGFADADEMLLKARLAARIGQIVAERGLTQRAAAGIIGLPQAKVSRMLGGEFRGISVAKMTECLRLLGNDVVLLIRPTREGAGAAGHREVVFG